MNQDIARVVSETLNGTLFGPDQLVEAFYPELKRLAASKMRGEVTDHTWQPTVLVNELFLELTRVRELRPVHPMNPQEKAAFFALAAQVMSRLLARHTRPLSWKAEKAGFPPALRDLAPGADQLALLENVLGKLAAIDPQLRSVVEMRVFEGLPKEEIAVQLGCSSRTVGRYWQFAKEWLQAQLYGAEEGQPAL